MEIEKQIAKDNHSLDAFKKKWSRLKTSPPQMDEHELSQGSET